MLLCLEILRRKKAKDNREPIDTHATSSLKRILMMLGHGWQTNFFSNDTFFLFFQLRSFVGTSKLAFQNFNSTFIIWMQIVLRHCMANFQFWCIREFEFSVRQAVYILLGILEELGELKVFTSIHYGQIFLFFFIFPCLRQHWLINKN